MEQNIYTIQSKKYDGAINRSWDCVLLETKDPLYILKGTFKEEIDHQHIGVIRPNTVSIEYFWLDKWFNVFKFLSPNEDLLGFYCNISLPPQISNSILCFVDLDVDIFVDSNFNISVLDVDEFLENCEKYKYPKEVVKKTEQTINELKEMIRKRNFPFDTN